MRANTLDARAAAKGAAAGRRPSDWRLYAMLAAPAIIVFIFSYIPIGGVLIAFQNYSPDKGVLGSEFVGLKWFRVFFAMPDSARIVANTVAIAVGKIACSQLASVVFALLLNEVRGAAYKRSLQTITYFPHFLSWVIIGTVFIDMLSTRGLVNQILGAFGTAPKFFLGDPRLFQPTAVLLETWKEFGWGAIMYLAAISNISPDLYEAATIDGAGRLKQALHVTLPGIRGIALMLAVLALGGILNAGFEQILVLYNPSVYETGDIVDTFIYRYGLLDAQFSMSAAIGLFKSLIGLALMLAANWAAARFSDYRVL
ncbi:MAG: ABC transporter permease subunit [Clostridiales bacterium]|jgi:putative aldouronate transport system permease protein|nr:ABC transporter permease subunit [Clostridiales bacterium]